MISDRRCLIFGPFSLSGLKNKLFLLSRKGASSLTHKHERGFSLSKARAKLKKYAANLLRLKNYAPYK
jgi:hypothetical protein